MGPSTSDELARQVLRQHAAAFAEHAPQALDSTDPEHVHQTRVATRRLRAALRVFDDVLPLEIKGLSDELQWIAAQLGSVRDLDVQLERLRGNALELGLTNPLVPYGAWLEDLRQRALAALNNAFQSQRFIELTERLRHLDDISTSASGECALEDDAAQRLRAAFRRLRRRAEDLGPHSPTVEFHQARIRAKRLRYTTEFFVYRYGKPAQRLIVTSTALQDLLGDHQDTVVSGERIHEAVHTVAGTWPAETSLALGRVVQWEAQHGAGLRRRAKSTYREVEDAWERVRRAL